MSESLFKKLEMGTPVGLATSFDGENFPLGVFDKAENITYDIDGDIRKREGFTVVDNEKITGAELEAVNNINGQLFAKPSTIDYSYEFELNDEDAGDSLNVSTLQPWEYSESLYSTSIQINGAPGLITTAETYDDMLEFSDKIPLLSVGTTSTDKNVKININERDDNNRYVVEFNVDNILNSKSNLGVFNVHGKSVTDLPTDGFEETWNLGSSSTTLFSRPVLVSPENTSFRIVWTGTGQLQISDQEGFDGLGIVGTYEPGDTVYEHDDDSVGGLTRIGFEYDDVSSGWAESFKQSDTYKFYVEPSVGDPTGFFSIITNNTHEFELVGSSFDGYKPLHTSPSYFPLGQIAMIRQGDAFGRTYLFRSPKRKFKYIQSVTDSDFIYKWDYTFVGDPNNFIYRTLDEHFMNDIKQIGNLRVLYDNDLIVDIPDASDQNIDGEFSVLTDYKTYDEFTVTYELDLATIQSWYNNLILLLENSDTSTDYSSVTTLHEPQTFGEYLAYISITAKKATLIGSSLDISNIEVTDQFEGQNIKDTVQFFKDYANNRIVMNTVEPYATIEDPAEANRNFTILEDVVDMDAVVINYSNFDDSIYIATGQKVVVVKFVYLSYKHLDEDNTDRELVVIISNLEDLATIPTISDATTFGFNLLLGDETQLVGKDDASVNAVSTFSMVPNVPVENKDISITAIVNRTSPDNDIAAVAWTFERKNVATDIWEDVGLDLGSALTCLIPSDEIEQSKYRVGVSLTIGGAAYTKSFTFDVNSVQQVEETFFKDWPSLINKCKYSEIIYDKLVLYGNETNEVYTSQIFNPLYFVETNVIKNTVFNNNEEVLKIHPYKEDMLLFTSNTMSYLSGQGNYFAELPWQITPLDGSIGINNHEAITSIEGTTVFLSENGMWLVEQVAVSEKRVEMSKFSETVNDISVPKYVNYTDTGVIDGEITYDVYMESYDKKLYAMYGDYILVYDYKFNEVAEGKWATWTSDLITDANKLYKDNKDVCLLNSATSSIYNKNYSYNSIDTRDIFYPDGHFTDNGEIYPLTIETHESNFGIKDTFKKVRSITVVTKNFAHYSNEFSGYVNGDDIEKILVFEETGDRWTEYEGNTPSGVAMTTTRVGKVLSKFNYLQSPAAISTRLRIYNLSSNPFELSDIFVEYDESSIIYQKLGAVR